MANGCESAICQNQDLRDSPNARFLRESARLADEILKIIPIL